MNSVSQEFRQRVVGTSLFLFTMSGTPWEDLKAKDISKAKAEMQSSWSLFYAHVWHLGWDDLETRIGD